MTGALRSIPPLLPPSRPKKQPSPRLTPRRNILRSPSGSRRIFESQFQGQENNDIAGKYYSYEDDGGAMNGSSFHAKPLISTINMSSSIPTSPLKSTPRSQARRRKQLQVQQEQQQLSSRKDPQSPNTAVHGPFCNLNHPIARSDPQYQDKNDPNMSLDYSKTKNHEDAAPLTPRNLVMEAATTSEGQAECTLTPPVSCPKPLIVAAKQFGNEVRRGNPAKRRRPEDDDSPYSSEEDEDMILPENLSPTTRTQEYWKRCYGTSQSSRQLGNFQSSWSASRAAPAKGCLSHSKPPMAMHAQAHIMLPPTSALMQSPPLTSGESPVFSTPRSSPEEALVLLPQLKCSHSKSVQFGCAQAAEYDIDAPSAKLTPLPPDIAQQRYPLTYEQDKHEEEEIEETKENTAVLSEWDEDFDSFVEDGGEDDGERLSKPKKRHSSRKQRLSSSKKYRKNKKSERRRSSSFFSRNNSKALFDLSEDNDETKKDEKSQEGMVLDNMASLSMASPVDGKEKGDQAQTEQAVPATVSMEAVSPTFMNMEDCKASFCSVTPQHSEERLSPSAADFQISALNFWEKIKQDPSILNQDRHWDPRTVLTSAADSPTSLWTIFREAAGAKKRLDSAMDIIGCFHDCVKSPLQLALGHLEKKIDGRVKMTDEQVKMISATEYEFDNISASHNPQFERVSEYEWKKLELEFWQNVVQQLDTFRSEAGKPCYILESIMFPEEASRSPTCDETKAAERDIENLQFLIAQEEREKVTSEQQYSSALVKLQVCKTTLSALSTHTAGLLSSASFTFTSQGNEAIFTHVVDGLETRLALDESGRSVIRHLPSCDVSKSIPRNHIASKFCNALLCSGDGTMLQEYILNLVSKADNMREKILVLSTVIGRMDLATLSLQQLSQAFEVSLNAVMECDNPVIVVKIHLPQKMSVNAFYRRSNVKSVFWSTPSNIVIEQDGIIVEELMSALIEMANSRSLGWTAGCIQAACELALEKLAGQTLPFPNCSSSSL